MNREPKVRTVTFRKDTFLQKISRSYPSLTLHAAEELKNITVMNNSVILTVGVKDKKRNRF